MQQIVGASPDNVNLEMNIFNWDAIFKNSKEPHSNGFLHTMI